MGIGKRENYEENDVTLYWLCSNGFAVKASLQFLCGDVFTSPVRLCYHGLYRKMLARCQGLRRNEALAVRTFSQ